MPPDNILNTLLSQFQTSADAMYPLIVVYMMPIFLTMTFAQVGLMSVNMLRCRDWQQMLETFFWGMVRVLTVYVVLTNLWDWSNDIINALSHVGAEVSGQSPGVLTPSGIYDLGLQTIKTLAVARSWGAWLDIVDDFLFAVLMFIVQYTWLSIALVYLWIQIEIVFAIALGPIKLCWASFDYTAESLWTWGESLLRAGTKLLAVLIVLAVGLRLANGWSADLAGLGTKINSDRLYYAFLALTEAVAFFIVVWEVPRKAAQSIKVMGAAGNWGGSDSMAASMLATGTMAVRTTGTAAVTGAAGAVGVGKGLGQYVQRRLM